MSELHLQSLINADLRKLGIKFIHDEMGRGKNHRHRSGKPDLLIFPGNQRVCFIELKSKTGQLQPEQLEFCNWSKENGYHYYIVKEFRQWELVKKFEGLKC